ncbi:hypothetical protein ACFL1N_13485 [Thermodesulfobacteriota bacterium]
MKTVMQALLICLLAFCGNAFAQNDISGTWGGKLEIAPGRKMTIRFIISKNDDGSYKAMMNSPDAGPNSDLPATALEYTEDRLSIEVDKLSASFSGIVGMDTITGEWKQPGITLPMVLTAYEVPSTDTIQQLLGEWYGSFEMPNGRSYMNLFQFTKENNRVSATYQVVGQGQQGVPVTDIYFKGNQISFLIGGQLKYKGVLDGKTITGTGTLGATEMEFNLTKGRYIEPGIDMSAEDIKKLQGTWVGRVKTITGVMITNVLTFEPNEQGKLKAAARIPERGNRTVKLVSLVFNENRLSFEMEGVRKTFSGKVNSNTMNGIFTYQGRDTEVALTRGAKIEPIVTRIEIPDATMEKLMGRWSGNIGQTQLVFRFERNAKGENAIFLDLPQRRDEGTCVLDASFAGGELSMKTPDYEYSGSLKDNKIDGVFKDGGRLFPLLLTKEESL